MVSCPRALRSASRRSRCPSKRALACLACSSFRVSSAESTVSSLFFQVAFVRPFAAEGASDVLYVCRSLLRQTVDDFLANYALVVGHSSLRSCWNSQTSWHSQSCSSQSCVCSSQAGCILAVAKPSPSSTPDLRRYFSPFSMGLPHR